MDGVIELPIWLAWILGLLALAGLIDRLLMPSVRWFVRRRVNRVIEDVNARLKLKLPPFKLTKRRVLIDRLQYDPRVLAAVEEEAAARGELREAIMAEASRYAREIVPAFNAYVYFHAGYALARRLARAFYRVRIAYADQDALDAMGKNATVIFAMNHRSNMDYVLVAYLAAGQTALSYAVGEWARVWPLQTLIRAMGAYFIRRNSQNPLYRRVLERYVQMAVEGGIPQAVYPEGGLSRDGRLRPPKLGLIDYMTKHFDPRLGRDILFVPVGINYDRVLEDRSLLASHTPNAPRAGLVKAILIACGFLIRNLGQRMNGRWRRFGYASVVFGRPVSLSAWIAANGGKDFRGLDKDDRFARIQNLADHVMAEVARAIPILPVPLVACLLRQGPPRGMTRDELLQAAEAQLAMLGERRFTLVTPRPDAAMGYAPDAIEEGIAALKLRRLVDEDVNGYIRCVPQQESVLDYYALSIENHWTR